MTAEAAVADSPVTEQETGSVWTRQTLSVSANRNIGNQLVKDAVAVRSPPLKYCDHAACFQPNCPITSMGAGRWCDYGGRWCDYGGSGVTMGGGAVVGWGPVV